MKNILLIPIFFITLCSCDKDKYECYCCPRSNIKMSTRYTVRESNAGEAIKTCTWKYKSYTGLPSSEIQCSIQ